MLAAGQFATILNAPPDSIGSRIIGDNTQLNLFKGAVLTDGIHNRTNTSVEINMAGGTVGADFSVNSGGVLNLSGGSVGIFFRARSGSEVNFFGGEFELNGQPYTASTAILERGTSDILTGTLADGSPFIFSAEAGDYLDRVTLIPTTLPPRIATPFIIDASTDPDTIPTGLRRGQSLTLREGGTLSSQFAVIDAALRIEGGSNGSIRNISRGIEINGSTVDIFGGAFLNTTLDAHANSTVNLSSDTFIEFIRLLSDSQLNMAAGIIETLAVHNGSSATISGGEVEGELSVDTGGLVRVTGGTIGDGAFLTSNATLILTDGQIGTDLTLRDGATVTVIGGKVGERLSVGESSTVNIAGGIIGQSFNAQPGSTINLVGQSFELDGQPLALEPGESTTVSLRDALITGTLADGSPFRFSLNAIRKSKQDYFSPNALLTVRLVPEPTTLTVVFLFGLYCTRRSNKTAH